MGMTIQNFNMNVFTVCLFDCGNGCGERHDQKVRANPITKVQERKEVESLTLIVMVTDKC